MLYVWHVIIDGRSAFVYAKDLHEAFHAYFGQRDADQEASMKPIQALNILRLGPMKP